jgi:endonuclease YncB( thermonuclease family)
LGAKKLIRRTQPLRFPGARKSKLRTLAQNLGWLVLFAAIVASAWYLDDLTNQRETMTAKEGEMSVADGDSFAIGGRKLRLDGIDAPEYRQTCKDALGVAWECGKAARSALEEMLRAPGLVCKADVTDRYSRSIATCSNAKILDIAAAQVASGWAVSSDFYGLRSYGSEEDSAKYAKRGIWSGEFVHPRDWRDLNNRAQR